MASFSTRRQTPKKEIMQGLSAVPTGSTALTSKDSMIFQVVIANTTAGALTITITDAASSAKDLYKAVSIAANTTRIDAYPEGVIMTGGITWIASGAGLVAEIAGFVRTS